jgi:hypothetical protein
LPRPDPPSGVAATRCPPSLSASPLCHTIIFKGIGSRDDYIRVILGIFPQKSLHKVFVGSYPADKGSSWIVYLNCYAYYCLWIQISRFFGLPDPDQSIIVRIRILYFYQQAKKIRKTVISTILWLLFGFSSLKSDVHCTCTFKR